MLISNLSSFVAFFSHLPQPRPVRAGKFTTGGEAENRYHPVFPRPACAQGQDGE
jgi:hypothetical protein